MEAVASHQAMRPKVYGEAKRGLVLCLLPSPLCQVNMGRVHRAEWGLYVTEGRRQEN